MAIAEETKHARIAADLRDQITGGALVPGEGLLSERDYATEYGASRETIRKVLHRLTQEGLLVPGPAGSPRRVANPQPLVVHITRTADLTAPGEQPALGADDWVGATARAGYEAAQDIEVADVYPGEQVRRRLQVGADEMVTTRRLLRRIGRHPHNKIEFWFPRDIAAGTPLAGRESITEGSAAWLDKHYGPLKHQVEPKPKMPGPEEADLRVPDGVPVQVLWRTSWNADRPVMCSMAVYPADRTELVIKF